MNNKIKRTNQAQRKNKEIRNQTLNRFYFLLQLYTSYISSMSSPTPIPTIPTPIPTHFPLSHDFDVTVV